jgi:hypothetical protein
MQWSCCEACASVVLLEGCFESLGIHVCSLRSCHNQLLDPTPRKESLLLPLRMRERGQAYNCCIVNAGQSLSTPPSIYLRTRDKEVHSS